MASSVILRPNGAAVGSTTGGATAPTIVGSPPQLGDQSDATYVTVSSTPGPAESIIDAAYEPLTINPAWVTRVDAYARSSSPIANHPKLRWLSSAVTFTHPILFVDTDLAIPGGAGIVETSATIADVPLGTYFSTWTMLEAATFLTAADVYVEVQANAADLTVYDVWLEVFYTPTGVNPLRRYPPVNNGGSGPTRHYPRTVNRRAGGTY